MTLKEYLLGQRGWLEDFLTGLCAIPSVSGQEAEAMRYLLDAFAGWDAELREVPISDAIKCHPEYSSIVKNLDYAGRANLRLLKRGSGGRRLALNTHVDVVQPSAGQENPFAPRVDAEGVLWARGACDAKGQIAAMALLVKAACEFAPLRHDIVCDIVIEEEFGGNGTVALLDAEPDFTADMLVNMEPTNLRVQTSIRGALWFEMAFTGSPGHTGSAVRGVSALDKAIAAIDLMKAYHAKLLERSKDYGLFKGKPNPLPLTIGGLNAGEWPSMVPGSAVLKGLIGVLPNTTREAVMREIAGLFDRPESAWIGEGMSMEFVYRHNAVETDPNHPLVRALSRASDACGLDGTPDAMTASSDATYYFERGIPAVAFGPGSISTAHSRHEHVALSDILKAAEVLYTMLDHL
ncbi:MAG: M20 family metallopeptidase [Clostridiales bacterium]|nr:M20 family metallopeptidase [Clostridiales bacterium]